MRMQIASAQCTIDPPCVRTGGFADGPLTALSLHRYVFLWIFSQRVVRLLPWRNLSRVPVSAAQPVDRMGADFDSAARPVKLVTTAFCQFGATCVA